MDKNSHLLIFTIGPVQSFIAQARKTRDLYAGSLLLSKLIKDVGNEAINKYRATPIFPAKELFEREIDNKENTISALPNRFLMYINDANSGPYLEQYAKDQFRSIVLQHLMLNKNCPQRCLHQIDEFLQVYWVIYPLEKQDYDVAYEKAVLMLGAVKNTRIFHQTNEIGRKCSLCGERTALFYYSSKKNADNKIESGRFLRRYFALEAINVKNTHETAFYEGEGLCAICYYKRTFEDKQNKSYFYSTAKIALLDALQAVDENLRNNYKKLFNDKFDDQLYFEENLTKNYFMKHNVIDSDDNIEKILADAKKNLQKIVNTLPNKEGDFCKYYALIMLDGDDMGKWLSGKWLKKESFEKLSEFHGFITKELTTYAEKVRSEYVREHDGSLVYAGGDDVLAFVNLNHLFKVIKNIFDKFPKLNNLELIEIRGNKFAHPSCGIVIAHYKTPLSEVLKWARLMNKKAKGLKDKHGIGIAAITHSGTIKQCVFKYVPNFKTLENVVFEIKDYFSDQFILTFKEEFFRVFENQQIPGSQIGRYIEMILTELKRLMMRSKSKKDVDIKKIIDQINDLRPLLIQQVKEEHSETYFDIENFVAFFEIARFLSTKITRRYSDEN